MINPKLEIGDRIVLLYMDDEYSSVPMGTKGTVKSHSVVFGDDQYSVKWDNGSSLAIISGVDMWDKLDNMENRLTKKINEMTSSSSGGRYRAPLVLAPQIWKDEDLGAYTLPASKYLDADLAYDSYDNELKKSRKQIISQERSAVKKAEEARKMFTQNDSDGNPLNGYSPQGNKTPGTPKSIKKIANLPKSEYNPAIKNYPKEKAIIKKKRMVEDETERFKSMIQNADMWKNFNIRFFQKYLIAVRDSGITNMFGASPYLYLGKERIQHEFKYKEVPNEDSFEEVLDMADQSQAEMINGVIKILESKGIEPDLSNINRNIQRYASKIVQNYMMLF
jgi:hypothetical protein